MVILSIIIPAYNEEKRIDNTLRKCLKYLKSKKCNFEMIVVNDGSKDNTVKIVRKFRNVKLIDNKINHGKGFVVRQGMLKARGDYVLFCDADLSTPIEEVDNLMKYTKDYDVIIASRAVKESRVKTLQYRKLLGRVFAFFVNLLIVWGISDTQCGFKLFSKETAKKIFRKQTINGWAFDVEVLFLARKFGYKIKEVGVRWEHFDHKDVTPTGQSLKMLKEVLKIRWNSITGRYD